MANHLQCLIASAGLMNRYVAIVQEQKMHFAQPCPSTKAMSWQLLKSLTVSRSTLIWCHECWQIHTKRQWKQMHWSCLLIQYRCESFVLEIDVEMCPGFAGLNLNPSGSRCSGTTWHPRGRRNLRMHHQHKKMVHANAMLHTHTHTHTRARMYALLMPSALLTTSQNLDARWPHWPSSDLLLLHFHPFDSLKDSLWGHHCADDKALWNAMWYLLQREKSNSYWVAMLTAVRRWKKIVEKDGDCIKKK